MSKPKSTYQVQSYGPDNVGFGINRSVGGAAALGTAIPALRSSTLNPGRKQSGQNKGSNPPAKSTPQVAGHSRREKWGLGKANYNKIVNRT
jgi:hypothetical protein